MPVVTGNVNDVRGVPLPTTLGCRVKFTLSGLGAGGAFIFLQKPVYATVNSLGDFDINLVPTSTMTPPDLFYTMQIEYLAPESGFSAPPESFDFKLYLGTTGGFLPDLLAARSRPEKWWQSDVAAVPPNAQTGDWLFVTTTDDVYRIR